MFTREAPSALRRRAAVLNQGLGFRASGERYFLEISRDQGNRVAFVAGRHAGHCHAPGRERRLPRAFRRDGGGLSSGGQPSVPSSAEGREKEFPALLKADWLGSETRGATLGLDAKKQMFVLHMMLTGSLEVNEFKSLLANFVKSARDWKEKLQQSAGSQDSQPFAMPHFLAV